MPGDVSQTLLLIEDDPHLPLLLEHMLERRWTDVAQKLVCVTSLRQDGAFQVTYGGLTAILSGEEFGKRLTQQSVGLDCVQCLARWVERGTAVLRPLIITQGA